MSKDVIAYPYAKAAFEYAKETAGVPIWKAFVEKFSMFFQAPEVIEYIGKPSVVGHSVFKLWDAFLDVFPEFKNQLAFENFFKILAEAGRLGIIGNIHGAFEELCLEESALVEALVTSARALTSDQKNQIKASLKTKFTQDVELICEEDPSLIAGLRISVGDWVFDNSLKGRFERLKSAINND
jgi:F-type H+-transporting ATPase subunit delta